MPSNFFSAAKLLAKAKQITSVDIQDTQALEPIKMLVDSLNCEAHLLPDGAIEMEKRLLRLLANRLRMERDYLKYPEINDQKIVSPVFIPSLPRTGSTKLQKLLCSLDEFTTLNFWMGHNPSLITGDRRENPQPRIDNAREYEQWLEQTVPETKLIHSYQAFEPEEPNPLNEHSLYSHYFGMFVEVPSYIEWLQQVDPDVSKQLTYMKRMLKYLQWQFDISENKPWVIKNPGFLGHDLAILDVFPDARLIMSHRNPIDIIPSAINLMMTFHRLYSDIDIRASMTRSMLEGQAYLITKHLNNKRLYNLAVLDIAYAEIAQNGAQAVRKIFDFIGMPFTNEHAAKIGEIEKSRPKNQFGSHHYSLEDFNLTETEVEKAFDEYTKVYADYLM